MAKKDISTVAFLSENPNYFPGGYDERSLHNRYLKEELEEGIRRAIKAGARTFISPMRTGPELWAAEMVQRLKGEYPDIRLHAIPLPPTQVSGWPSHIQKRYSEVLQQADERLEVKNLKRTLLDTADSFISVHSGNEKRYTLEILQTAYMRKKPIYNINPDFRSRSWGSAGHRFGEIIGKYQPEKLTGWARDIIHDFTGGIVNQIETEVEEKIRAANPNYKPQIQRILLRADVTKDYGALEYALSEFARDQVDIPGSLQEHLAMRVRGVYERLHRELAPGMSYEDFVTKYPGIRKRAAPIQIDLSDVINTKVDGTPLGVMYPMLTKLKTVGGVERYLLASVKAGFLEQTRNISGVADRMEVLSEMQFAYWARAPLYQQKVRNAEGKIVNVPYQDFAQKTAYAAGVEYARTEKRYWDLFSEIFQGEEQDAQIENGVYADDTFLEAALPESSLPLDVKPHQWLIDLANEMDPVDPYVRSYRSRWLGGYYERKYPTGLYTTPKVNRVLRKHGPFINPETKIPMSEVPTSEMSAPIMVGRQDAETFRKLLIAADEDPELEKRWPNLPEWRKAFNRLHESLTKGGGGGEKPQFTIEEFDAEVNSMERDYYEGPTRPKLAFRQLALFDLDEPPQPVSLPPANRTYRLPPSMKTGAPAAPSEYPDLVRPKNEHADPDNTVLGNAAGYIHPKYVSEGEAARERLDFESWWRNTRARGLDKAAKVGFETINEFNPNEDIEIRRLYDASRGRNEGLIDESMEEPTSDIQLARRLDQAYEEASRILQKSNSIAARAGRNVAKRGASASVRSVLMENESALSYRIYKALEPLERKVVQRPELVARPSSSEPSYLAETFAEDLAVKERADLSPASSEDLLPISEDAPALSDDNIPPWPDDYLPSSPGASKTAEGPTLTYGYGQTPDINQQSIAGQVRQRRPRGDMSIDPILGGNRWDMNVEGLIGGDMPLSRQMRRANPVRSSRRQPAVDPAVGNVEKFTSTPLVSLPEGIREQAANVARRMLEDVHSSRTVVNYETHEVFWEGGANWYRSLYAGKTRQQQKNLHRDTIRVLNRMLEGKEGRLRTSLVGELKGEILLQLLGESEDWGPVKEAYDFIGRDYSTRPLDADKRFLLSKGADPEWVENATPEQLEARIREELEKSLEETAQENVPADIPARHVEEANAPVSRQAAGGGGGSGRPPKPPAPPEPEWPEDDWENRQPPEPEFFQDPDLRAQRVSARQSRRFDRGDHIITPDDPSTPEPEWPEEHWEDAAPPEPEFFEDPDQRELEARRAIMEERAAADDPFARNRHTNVSRARSRLAELRNEYYEYKERFDKEPTKLNYKRLASASFYADVEAQQALKVLTDNELQEVSANTRDPIEQIWVEREQTRRAEQKQRLEEAQREREQTAADANTVRTLRDDLRARRESDAEGPRAAGSAEETGTAGETTAAGESRNVVDFRRYQNVRRTRRKLAELSGQYRSLRKKQGNDPTSAAFNQIGARLYGVELNAQRLLRDLSVGELGEVASHITDPLEQRWLEDELDRRASDYLRQQNEEGDGIIRDPRDFPTQPKEGYRLESVRPGKHGLPDEHRTFEVRRTGTGPAARQAWFELGDDGAWNEVSTVPRYGTLTKNGEIIADVSYQDYALWKLDEENRARVRADREMGKFLPRLSRARSANTPEENALIAVREMVGVDAITRMRGTGLGRPAAINPMAGTYHLVAPGTEPGSEVEVLSPADVVRAHGIAFGAAAEVLGDRSSLPTNIPARIATIQKRILDAALDGVQEFTEDLRKKGISPDVARMQTERFRNVVRFFADEVADAATDKLRQEFGLRPSDVGFRYDIAQLKTLEEVQALAARSPIVQQQLRGRSLEEIWRSGQAFTVVDEEGYAFDIGSGGRYGSVGARRAGGLWSGPIGSMMYGAYMLTRGWSMAIGPAIQQAHDYGKFLSSFGFTAPEGAYMQGTDAGAATRRQLGELYMGQASRQVLGPLVDINYALGQSPALARILTTGKAAGTVAFDAAVAGYMMQMMAPGTALAAAGSALGAVGLTIGGVMLAGTLGMEAYNAWLKPQDRPMLSWGNLIPYIRATWAEKDAALAMLEERAEQNPEWWSQLTPGQRARLTLPSSWTEAELRSKMDEDLANFLYGSETTDEIDRATEIATRISEKTTETPEQVVAGLALQKRMFGMYSEAFSMEASRIAVARGISMEQQIREGAQVASSLGFTEGTIGFRDAIVEYNRLSEKDPVAASKMASRAARIGQYASQLDTLFGPDDVRTVTRARAKSPYDMNVIERSMTADVVERYNMSQQEVGLAYAYLNQVKQMGGQIDEFVMEQAAAFATTTPQIIAQTAIQAMGVGAAAGYSVAQVSDIGSMFTNLTPQQADIYSKILGGDLRAASFQAWNNGSFANRLFDRSGNVIWETSGSMAMSFLRGNTDLRSVQRLGNVGAMSNRQLAEAVLGTSNSRILDAFLRGGTREIEAQARRDQANVAIAMTGIQLRGIELQENYLWGSRAGGTWDNPAARSAWGIEDQLVALQHRSTLAGFEEQRTRMELTNAYAIQREYLQGRRMEASHDFSQWQWSSSYNQFLRSQMWAREDWQYEDTMRGLQFAWGMEDLNEAIRFSSGRERRMLIRQRDRQALTHSLEGEQIETRRSRQEEVWAQEDERFRKQKEYMLEMQALDRENFDLNRRQREEFYRLDREAFERRVREYEEEKTLQDQMRELSREYQYQQLQLQREAAALQASAAQAQREYADALLKANQTMSDIKGEMEMMNSYSNAYRLAVAIREMTGSLNNLSPTKVDKIIQLVNKLNTPSSTYTTERWGGLRE